MLFHKHCLIKGYIKNPPKEAAVLNEWLSELVGEIKMKTLMGPYSKYLNTVGNRGITGIVVIETSHISCHIWDEPSPALVQMDVYSCKNFDVNRVTKKLKDFHLVSKDILVVDRNGKKLKVIK